MDLKRALAGGHIAIPPRLPAAESEKGLWPRPESSINVEICTWTGLLVLDCAVCCAALCSPAHAGVLNTCEPNEKNNRRLRLEVECR